MLTAQLASVLTALGVRASSAAVLKDVPPGNASWLVETSCGQRLVLRRYHSGASAAAIEYEHAVLRHLAMAGWVVPEPVTGLIRDAGFRYCLTRYVAGSAIASESPAHQRRRGRDLARLHGALRGLGQQLGQRPGWRAQHEGFTVHTRISWQACVDRLMSSSPALASWASAAATQTHRALTAVGPELPLTVVHGDFAAWNVHYQGGRLAGVIDFGLAHLDSRPYELAAARAHRAPHLIGAYRTELARNGWPLTESEEAAIDPLYRAFRLDMIAWRLDHCLGTGEFDAAFIQRQLARTGTAPP